MEVAAKSNSKPMYSWWWDSHNTPKNSKWLQENLADMDSNVKKMIKVLEEDADSFARRAEMYYHKRPELMQLVEEFYRAYRALAERYNHATGVIHKAHVTIAEAFPNQVPLIFGDVDPPQTPDMHPPFRARFNPDEIKRNIDFSEDAPQFVSNGKARKGLNFNDEGGKRRDDLKCEAEAEVMGLKDSISKMEVEKEASLAQFEKSLEKLSNLESELARAQEESRGFNHRAVIAEAEIQTLRENLEKLESDYQKCLRKIAEAGEISERASKAESETLSLKESLAKAEERLRKAEEDSRFINERAEKAGLEVEKLKQTISKLVEDKEASEIQYQQCLNIIADLKLKLYHVQEVTQKLNSEVEDGVAKLKFSEEKCLVLERSNQNLHSELDSLLEKLGNQSEKLTEKQTELVKLWSCVQEEHLRFQEAETAFQTLQQLHSQSQEELNNLGLELETRSQIMKDMETRNNELHEEIQQAKVEKKADVSSLKETIRKLEGEVELRVYQRNALQQEIYFLKEELSQVKKKHESMVESVGSSMKSLQEFNQREKSDKMALFEKLETMEKLIQKNFLLEKSITDLNYELEAIREKLKTIEVEAYESVTEEKSGHAIENIVLVESLRRLATEKKSLEEELERIKVEKEKLNQEVLKEKKSESELREWESQAATFLISTVHETLVTHELAEACKNLEIEEKLKIRSQDSIVLLNESIKSLEDYVFTNRKSEDKINDSTTEDGFVKLEDMCMRIKAVSEAIIEKEKLLMLENTNAYSMLEDALKQIKDLKLGGSGRRSIRKVQQEGGGGSGGKTRKPSHHEIEMVMKDIVLDQTSDGSSYEIKSKRRDLKSDYDHSFVELKPVKTKTKTHVKGKSLSEESLVIDKMEIFDGFMDPNREVNEKRKVIERLDSDLRKLENLQITLDDLKTKVGGTEKVDGYETIKGELEEAEEAVEKLLSVNRKLMTKAESWENENSSGDRRRRLSEQARRGSEKIGKLQLELQRIQFLLVNLDGEKQKENRARSKISDSKSKVLLRDYIYGGTRSVSMKKKTKKRSAFCGCVQQPRSP